MVANPPYITEPDDARKAYHKERIGRAARTIRVARTNIPPELPVHRSAPSSSRARRFHVGVIVDNQFMRRDFGVRYRRVLRKDLTLWWTPHSPTFRIMGLRRRCYLLSSRLPHGPVLRVVAGKKGEDETPSDPAQGPYGAV